MTKKDYERAATIVQFMRSGLHTPNQEVIALGAEHAFVELFTGDNPRFDEARFRAACIPGANVKARPRKPKSE